jgi:hypothetical protein
MNLFIETENGATKNHPALEDNLIQAFVEVPSHWEPFIRIERPVLGPYQVLESDEPIYTKVDGVWTDVWTVREITTEEKTAKQQSVITQFNIREQASNWSAWTLDETTCTMQPPTPQPDSIEGKLMLWCGAESNWKEAPSRPEGEYKFDFFAWQWEVVEPEEPTT